MTISTKQNGNVVIVEFHSDILGGADSMLLHDTTTSLLGQSHRAFVFDLSKVSYMNSSGLGALTSVFNTIRQSGGRLTIACASERIHSLFSVTKLDHLFELYPTVDDAIVSFD